jgi:hypothetical protein
VATAEPVQADAVGTDHAIYLPGVTFSNARLAGSSRKNEIRPQPATPPVIGVA